MSSFTARGGGVVCRTSNVTGWRKATCLDDAGDGADDDLGRPMEDATLLGGQRAVDYRQWRRRPLLSLN
ncbi:uncharacterized protein HKW66_Vig0089290 [Vigna angularis]|uniref:Uncharacterized protein n=1 Tax=Phaseolus angularis TaxID=3914 RepID=A0A8T0KFE8_PHAAN|nr:uncharacterized protein HKW66_Vig0089290 [Vigna angularis]